MLWNQRGDIFNLKYNSVVITGGKSRSEYGDYYIETRNYCKTLTEWCIRTSKKIGVWILFAMYCDLNEEEYFHIENDYEFEILFNKFESIFFNETNKELL